MYNYRRKELKTRPAGLLKHGTSQRVERPILWVKYAGSSRERIWRNVRILGVSEEPVKWMGEWTMKDVKNVLRVVGMILLGVFKVAGLTFGIITGLIGLAIFLIKVAVVLAVGYLILVGIRALLR
jgi:hypothetical protein